jgi:hypothetical protein
MAKTDLPAMAEAEKAAARSDRQRLFRNM